MSLVNSNVVSHPNAVFVAKRCRRDHTVDGGVSVCTQSPPRPTLLVKLFMNKHILYISIV
jgi:hypothetical protein